MPTENNKKNIKKEKIEELNQKIKDAKAIFFTDYRGLSVNKLQELRQKLDENHSELQVTKNTLLNIALKNNNTELEKELEGPTATLFAYGDELEPLKSILNFAKENNDLPEVKLGMVDGIWLKIDKLKQLALLPGKDILRGQFVGTLNAPLSGLVYSLNFHTQSFINVLKNIEGAKGTDN